MNVLDRLGEALDGAMVKMLPLYGRDVSPIRPGEPLPGTPGYQQAMGAMEAGNLDLGDRERGLYPRLNRPELLRLYDDMDNTDLPASVLDMQAEDATTSDNDANDGPFKVEHGNEAIRREVRRMLHSTGLVKDAFARCRAMLHYGSDFARNVYADGRGIVALLDTSPHEMRIERDRDTREVSGFREKGRLFRNRESPVSWPWDYTHFKLSGKRYEEPYGQSVLAGAIRPWTQMVLAEDKALLYRITRHPDRLFFKVDVGEASEAEAFRTVQNFRRSMRKNMNLDFDARRLRADYKPVGAMEDIWMAVRSESNSDVQLLQGSTNVQDVTDLNYYARKFLTATRTPPPMFGFDEPTGQGENYLRNKKLANQDVRYAKHILRVQTAFCAAVLQTAKTHLHLLATDVESALLDYDGNEDQGVRALKITMRPPSFLEEMERLELVQLRLQMATEMLALGQMSNAIDPYEQTLWVYKEILRLPEAEVRRIVVRPPSPSPEELAQAGGQPGAKAESGGLLGMSAVNETAMFDRTEGGVLAPERAQQVVRLLLARPALTQRIVRLAEFYDAKRFAA